LSAGGNSFAPCDAHLGEHFLRELRTDLDELAARIAQLVRESPRTSRSRCMTSLLARRMTWSDASVAMTSSNFTGMASVRSTRLEPFLEPCRNSFWNRNRPVRRKLSENEQSG